MGSAWNNSHDDSKRISIGDGIMAVNGILFRPDLMLNELSKSRKVHLVVCRKYAEATASERPEVQQELLSKESIDELADWQVDQDDCTVCAICLGEVNQGGPALVLPCQHYFHQQCVTKWLTEYAPTCPVCERSADCSVVPDERVAIQPVRPCATPQLICIATSDSCFRKLRLFE